MRRLEERPVLWDLASYLNLLIVVHALTADFFFLKDGKNKTRTAKIAKVASLLMYCINGFL